MSEPFRPLITHTLHSGAGEDRLSRRMFVAAMVLAVLGILGSATIGYVAYNASRNRIEQAIATTILDQAQSLGQYVELSGRATDRAQFLVELQKQWEATPQRFAGRYLCVIGGEGELVLNTLRPQMIGADVSTIPLTPAGSGEPATVSELLKTKKNWVGRNTNRSGKQQLVAYVYQPTLQALVAVHVPAEEVDAELDTLSGPWRMGFGLFAFGVLPLAIFLFLMVHRNLQRNASRGWEEALSAAGLFHAYVDQAADAIFVHHLDGTFLDANPRACESLGYSRDELLSMKVWELDVEFDKETCLRIWEQTIAARESATTFESRHRRKDGSIFPVEVRIGLLNVDGQKYFLALARDISERMQTLESLRISEERYRTLIQTTTAVTWTVEPGGRFVEPQPSWQAYTGQTWNEYRGFGWVQALHPEDRDTIRQQWQAALTSLTNYHTEGRLWHAASSTYRYFVTRAVPLFHRDGTVREWIGTVMDMHDRRQAEEVIKASETILSTIHRVQSQFINSEDSATLFDDLLDTLLDSTNSEYGFIGEILQDELGQPYLRSLAITDISWDEESRNFYNQNLDSGLEFRTLDTLFGAVMVTGSVVICNDPSRDARSGGLPNGHPSMKSFIGLPFFRGTRLLGMVGLANRPGGYDQEFAQQFQAVLATCANLILAQRNIERRQAATAEVKRSELRFRQLVEATSDWVWEFDHHLRFTYISPQVEKILGYTPEEMLGRIPFEFMDPDEATRLGELFHTVLDTFRSYSLTEHTQVHKQGHAVVLESSGTPFFDEQGNYLGYRGISRDISQRRAAEKERESFFRDLEDKNAELERFTYTVSHDLKSPLITIKGFLGLLEQDLKDQDSEGIQRDFDVIGRAADRMKQLLDELLELSRIGRVANPVEPVPLAEVIQEAGELISGSATGVEFTIESITEMPTVRGDRIRLLEVIQNLFENAVKFSSTAEHPHVTVVVTQDGPEIVCSISDNGIGIAPKYLDRIFGLFEKLDGSTEGTGIGLALVKRIIEVHGGRIWAESEGLGTGTTVRFTLPVMDHPQLT